MKSFNYTLSDLLNFDRSLNTMVIMAIYLLLFGKILEPLANVFFNLLFKIRSFLGCFVSLKKIEDVEVNKMNEFIVKSIHENTNYKLTGSPFHFVKDFLITEGKGELFYVFLSRYGFYRSCVFTCFVLIVRNLFFVSKVTIFFNLIYFILMMIYFWRSNQFYSYQAPTLYRNYIMYKDAK